MLMRGNDGVYDDGGDRDTLWFYIMCIWWDVKNIMCGDILDVFEYVFHSCFSMVGLWLWRQLHAVKQQYTIQNLFCFMFSIQALKNVCFLELIVSIDTNSNYTTRHSFINPPACCIKPSSLCFSFFTQNYFR